MQVNSLISLSRAETHTTASQFSDATLAEWLSIIHKKVVRRIISEVNENYLTTYKELDAVANQSSYPLEADFGQLKLLKRKPTPEATNYVISREVDFAIAPSDFEYLALNQPMNDPIHQISGTSLFMAPRFTLATTGSAGNKQIYYEYEKTAGDLAVGGAETSILIPVDFHFVLAKGVKPMIYSALGKIGEKNDAIFEFDKEMDEMIYLLAGRDDTKNHLSIPNDVNLQ